jgi:glycerol-3-phosphate cytidylyltransferase-like family protein
LVKSKSSLLSKVILYSSLRALNIAAFEMVDYVYIDNNSKTLKLIKNVKPDFFAK